jgi:hypothetical protein
MAEFHPVMRYFAHTSVRWVRSSTLERTTIMHHLKRMCRHLLILSIVMEFSSLAQNQSADTTSLSEGMWALQFGIAPNFTLTSIQGTSISAKYQLSTRNAIRGGMTISGYSNDGNSTTSGIYADTSIGSIPGSNSSNSLTIAFTGQCVWYANPGGAVHFYTALGPVISYNYAKSHSDNPYVEGGYFYHYVSSSSSKQWGIGATGSAGVEWFPSQWFSLRAEYGESLQYQWRSTASSTDYSYTPKVNPSSHSENSGTSKGWTLGGSAVSFGLSVYW